MEPPNECSKETFRFAEFSQRVKMNQTKSKEKLYNDQTKGKSNSKLPRIVRSPSKFYKTTKSSTKLNEKLDNSGDSLPGPSKLANIQKIKKEELPEKLKPSQIPRRKFNKEGSKESCDSAKKIQGCNQFIPENKNVQRVHMLINPDFCPEDRTQTASIATTRPIPTLGQIYGRINMIDSDRLNDWFMELNTPMNSLASTQPGTHISNHLAGPSEKNTRTSSTVASPPTCHQDDLKRSTIVLDRKDNLMYNFSTPTNEDGNIWLSSDVEFPTRDNESGYQTMSVNNAKTNRSKQSQSEVQSVRTNNTYCLGLRSRTGTKSPSLLEPSVECSTATSSLLKEQQTVVLCRTPESTRQKVEEGTNISKHNVTIKPTRLSKPEGTKNFQFPSNVNHASVVHAHRVPVPSYTDCLSEILQKTTNFETMDAIESQKSPSSAAVTDAEIRDSLSNEETVDQMDEFGVMEEQSTMEWCRHHSQSNGNVTFVKSNTTGTNWSYKYQSECSEGIHQHHHHHATNWKHELCKNYYEDSVRDRCKKCQRFKRFPSSRYKLPRTFDSWRRRISIRRICRRRWNHVWKKTAERWATWSRTPVKFRKFRVMHYLQRSVIWEDADAQTNLLICNDAGTDSSLKEQKSTAIGTPFNTESWQAVCGQSESVSKDASSHRSKFRHVNLGPSMFPFLYNSKRKSLIPHTSEKGQSASQFLFTESEDKTDKEQSDNFIWNIEHGMAVCNPVKSSQCEDTITLPENVERSTSLLDMFDVKLTDECTDTEELRNFMKDKITSTLLRISPYRHPSTTSTDAHTQKVITCHNAETDVTFLPNLESNSNGTLTSGYDITYYRPLTGTDITHLISETRTQQALYPILRKFKSSPAAKIIERQRSTETQVSPKASVNKISTGVSTSSPTCSEKTTSYTQSSSIMRMRGVEKREYAAQAPEMKQISTDTETQMSPDVSKSIISTGVTSSNPTIISACLLLDNEVEKEHYAVQTQPQMANLASTDTKLMSISSRMLTDKNMSSTEMTIEKPPQTSNGTLAPVKCLCKATDVSSCGTEPKSRMYECTRSTSARGLDSYYETEILLNNLIKKALIGDGGSIHSSYSQRSEGRDGNKICPIYITAGTNTYVRQESKSVGPTASEIRRLPDSRLKFDTAVQYTRSLSEKQEAPACPRTFVCVRNCLKTARQYFWRFTCAGIARGDDKFAGGIADTCRSALVGQSQLVSMCMLNQTTNEVATQTDGQSERAPQLLYKCAASMTSYCGLAQYIQVPASTLNVKLSEISEKLECGCATLCCDTETNTDYCFTPNLERPTQTVLRPLRNDITSCSPLAKSMSSKAELQNNVNKQLVSLSRLIGKKRPSTTISPPITTPIFSSDFTADKWLKTCSSMEKAFDSMVGIQSSAGDEMKRNSLYYTSSSKSEIGDSKAPSETVSKDSLADVLPVKKSKDFYFKKQETRQSLNRIMVDEVTSDENVKDMKESILQACPEICETGTESPLSMFKQKSASVLTTQCVLPSPSPCSVHPNMEKPTECVFVYGEPRCAIHKRNANVSVQSDPFNDLEMNKKRECVNHSVGMLKSYSSMESNGPRKPSTLIREVLSPKVYKALYETTKLVVSEDTCPPTVRENTMLATRVDAEVEAATFHVPDMRSAGVVTSTGRGYPQRCYCKDRGTHANKCALYHVTKTVDTSHQTIESSSKYTHAKLLQMPDERKEGCFDDCMKTHLVTSCRYYSSLLTKQLGRVKENFTKHLAEPIEENVNVCQIPAFENTEACTMKPSGKTELASQTIRFHPYCKFPRHLSCCVLSPAVSLTDICKNDKDHLKSVYYMLSAIEGRLRRLKLSVPNPY